MHTDCKQYNSQRIETEKTRLKDGTLFRTPGTIGRACMAKVMGILPTLGIAFLMSLLTPIIQAQTLIQMRPRCDSVSILYPSDVSTSVEVINLPYKRVAGKTSSYFHPLLGQIPAVTHYTYHDGGPKVSLLNAVTLVKLDYSTDLSRVLLSYTVCLGDAGSTFIARVAQCLIDYPPADQSDSAKLKRAACNDAAIHKSAADVQACKDKRDSSTFNHMSATIADIDYFIDVYGGCTTLADEIASWERYWAHLQ